MRHGEMQKAPSPYLLVISTLFVTCLLTANLIAVKLVEVAGLVLPAAVIIFPISYIVGDVLTEVYGYAYARRVIWLGFFCNLIMVLAVWVAGLLPSAPFWEAQAAYQRILGTTPRILGASFAAYLVGEFANAYVLAKMKLATDGKWLWSRTIGSTLVGQGLDSLVFMTLAFAGSIPGAGLGEAILAQWMVKSAYEALATPFTYLVVNFLKTREGLDAMDRETRFSPFRLA